MRSERSPSAGTARRTTFTADEVVETFFNGWATKGQWSKAVFERHAGPRPSGEYPRASGEGVA